MSDLIPVGEKRTKIQLEREKSTDELEKRKNPGSQKRDAKIKERHKIVREVIIIIDDKDENVQASDSGVGSHSPSPDLTSDGEDSPRNKR